MNIICFPIERKRLTGAVISLCLAGATHSFLLFSFFPYAGYMGVTLLNNDNNANNDVTVNNVGIYAGMLGAAFTLGRFLGFLPWKVLRKSLGEKNALVLSLLLTGLSSLWVGLAATFSTALLARLFQGVSNCISGSVKRAAINARHNRKQERMNSSTEDDEEVYDANPEAMVLTVMWWGTALGPIVGGLLSDPGVLGWFHSETFASHPYLLSNGFSAILCWISMVAVAVTTTEPQNSDLATKLGEIRPLLAPATNASSSNDNKKHRKTESQRLWESFQTLWTTNKDARNHLIAYWSFSFVAVCCDEALPLFLITSSFGLSEARVGLLLSATGFLVAISHHAALDNVLTEGIYRVLSACAFFGNIPVVLVPLSLLLNDDNSSNLLGLTPLSFLYLVVLFAFLRGSASIFFSLIGIATGRTLRVVHKDEAARIMTMGALLVRSLAPIVAGAIVSHFMASERITVSTPLHSSWMVWIVIGLVFGLATTIVTFFLSTKSKSVEMTKKRQSYIENRLARMSSLASLADSLGGFYGSASRSICTRWNHCIAFSRKARDERRRSSLVMPNVQKIKEDLMEEVVEKKKRHTWKMHTVAPGVDFDAVSFFIIGTHKRDVQCAPHVLAPPIMAALQKQLPTNCSESNFWLKYSLLRDGASMHSIEAKCGLARNTIMAIETLNGDVFGCFMTKPWIPSNNHYRMAGESFLWRLKNRRITHTADEESHGSEISDDIIDVYPWTGNNELCQLFADDKIACGGGVVGTHSDGFGILLQGDLLSGSSSPCVTYGNPHLCGDGENQFEVANIEIWGLTPYMFVADAERSENTLRFIKENSHASYGDSSYSESPSSTSAWSTFM